MDTVLVTGCAGFIGSHVCESLLEKGFGVIGVDNFDSFYSRQVKERNLGQFAALPHFRFVEQDITDLDGLSEKTPAGFSAVIHLAAKAGVRPSIADPASYIDTNIHGTRNVLELMKMKGCRNMVFASSSSVYGDRPDTPFREGGAEDRPISPYAFSKRSAELLNYTYHHLYGINVVNNRLFTVYGPRQRPDLAIHKFVDLIANGKPIEMYGDGTTARDYTYVGDIVDGLIKSFMYLQEHGRIYEILNIGNSHPVPLRQLIDQIAAAMNTEAIVRQVPVQEGDVSITYADISKAKSLIGYDPKTKMEEGLGRFVDWYSSAAS